MPRPANRRLARLQQVGLDRLLSELRLSEAQSHHSANARSTQLLGAIRSILDAMPPNVRPSFTEFYNSLPIRYRTLISQAQRRQAGIAVDEPPPHPMPNCSWDEGEHELDGWTGITHSTPMKEAENVR